MKKNILFIFFLIISSCNPVKEIIYKTDYKYINLLQRDTINVHQIDSVIIETKNDTVYSKQISYFNRYVGSLIKDTVYHNDTIYSDKEVIKRVAVKKWYDPIKNTLAGIGILTIIFFIFYIILKVLRK